GLRSEPQPVMTERGKNELPAAVQARDYLSREWLRALQEGKWLDVYLATLPAAKRESERQAARDRLLSLQLCDGLGAAALPCAWPAAALTGAGLVANPDVGLAVLTGSDDFLAGHLLRADKDVFWAPEPLRAEVLAQVRQLFRRPDAQLVTMLTPDAKVRFPWMH